MAKRIYTRSDSGLWWYYRRVPKDIQHLDKRGAIRTSLKTKNQGTARGKACVLDAELEKYWDHLRLFGEAESEFEKHKQAIDAARYLGIRYIQSDRIASNIDKMSTAEIKKRVKIASEGNESERAAALGLAKRPRTRLSQLGHWLKRHNQVEDSQKSNAQVKRRYAVVDLALKQAVEAIGDKYIDEIDHYDGMTFRDWHSAKVLAGINQPYTGNRRINTVSMAWKAWHEAHGAHKAALISPFKGIKLKTQKQNSRPPFTTEFIRNRILEKGALDALNEDARLAVYLSIETGARLSEIVNLRDEDINLDCNIPYLALGQSDEREFKSKNATRDIPLVGISLWAAQKWQRPPSKYKEKGDTASATINKFFKENGLLETPKHSLYCFRHSFESRLRQAGAPERVMADLMGHAFDRPAYGAPDMAEYAGWLEKAKVWR